MPYSPRQNIPDNRDMQAPLTIKQYVSQMRKIPGERFTMGRTYEIKEEDDLVSYEYEVPANAVDISLFRMGTTPVTVGMWREYVRDNESLSMPKVPDWDWIDDHPIVNVTWDDISSYSRWASRVSRVKLILPTEAQWEYAAKGGQTTSMFPWGNRWDNSKLWSSNGEIRTRTAPVVRTKNIYVNPYGLTDMSGNVWEWCFDAFKKYSANKRDRLGYPHVIADPKVEPDLFIDPPRVVRGGGWDNNSSGCFRCANRFCFQRHISIHALGFRLSAPA